MKDAAGVVATYLVLVAITFASGALALEGTRMYAESFLPLIIPLAAMLAFWLTIVLHRLKEQPRPSPTKEMAEWTFTWFLLASVCLHIAAVVRGFSHQAALMIVVSAFGEELAFRRVPAALQHRLGPLSSAGTIVMAAATTTAFVLIHDTTHLLPTIDKIVFSLCAYYGCLRTQSLAFPTALHVTENAVASIWVSQSGSVAAGWFSAVSIVVSMLAVHRLSLLAYCRKLAG